MMDGNQKCDLDRFLATTASFGTASPGSVPSSSRSGKGCSQRIAAGDGDASGDDATHRDGGWRASASKQALVAVRLSQARNGDDRWGGSTRALLPLAWRGVAAVPTSGARHRFGRSDIYSLPARN